MFVIRDRFVKKKEKKEANLRSNLCPCIIKCYLIPSLPSVGCSASPAKFLTDDVFAQHITLDSGHVHWRAKEVAINCAQKQKDVNTQTSHTHTHKSHSHSGKAATVKQ